MDNNASHSPSSADDNNDPEPRWPAILAVFAVGALEFALPRQLSFGPGWLLLLVVLLLAIPATLARMRGKHKLTEMLGFASNGLITLAMIWSLALLVRSLPQHTLSPRTLLTVAAVLWTSNVLVFASWYWRLDAGGPHARDLRETHTEGAFLFPQMTLGSAGGDLADKAQGWTPGFVDYLFLAYNTSTAFSPTDAPVLSRWAKGLMMVQASISLVTIALLAARAVNIL
ncbi:hypothetical protein D1Y84_17195 [Acidipila sp. EB88]|nr:hypothetical protein D1Y84_17195 [Acidipila sp. EB88]